MKILPYAKQSIDKNDVDYNNKYPTGNVMKNTIREIWQSKIMNERRELHLKNKKGNIKICENCNVWDEFGEEFISSEYAEKASIPTSVGQK